MSDQENTKNIPEVKLQMALSDLMDVESGKSVELGGRSPINDILTLVRVQEVVSSFPHSEVPGYLEDELFEGYKTVRDKAAEQVAVSSLELVDYRNLAASTLSVVREAKKAGVDLGSFKLKR